MVRDTIEVFVDTFSFGGGIGGEFFEETAANLNTLSEAKREDDEVDCFCPDPKLLVDIVVQLRVGESDVPTGSAADGCSTGRT